MEQSLDSEEEEVELKIGSLPRLVTNETVLEMLLPLLVPESDLLSLL